MHETESTDEYSMGFNILCLNRDTSKIIKQLTIMKTINDTDKSNLDEFRRDTE